MQVRLTGEGDLGSGGAAAGNLYVYLGVQKHQFFRRDGNDLVYVMPLNMAEASLGVEKSVPTLDGEDHHLKVPPGTQPGQEFRIRGKGVPHLNLSRRGDLRVLVDLKVPSSLNARQRALLEELARTMGATDASGEAANDSTLGPETNGGSQNGESPVGDAGPHPGSNDDPGKEKSKDKGFFNRT